LRSIKVEDTSVIDSKLSEHHSDLLIRTSLLGSPALIYILVEHKKDDGGPKLAGKCDGSGCAEIPEVFTRKPALVPVEILRSVSSLPMDEKHRTFLSRLLEYIIEGCNDIDEQDVEQAFLSIGSREAREAYMALAERLIEKGKREGKREGELEGKLLDRLDQALGLIFKAETIAEVLRPLD
jgi:hypothetical protein